MKKVFLSLELLWSLCSHYVQDRKWRRKSDLRERRIPGGMKEVRFPGFQLRDMGAPLAITKKSSKHK
jgi:hypothetical protein